ncbi:TolB family protein [Muriicola sp. Z0-33]|uniref:TolB family protein n=1 Tax=Muriicola sp. Z0-33 TaxID=2816957 RepID=UPI002238D6E8|nr:cell envelope biogenesis protein OmpA [Muriicola sp. Z0-33]MCW5515498.1 PD40 domain-containing protein [Muriicola sp. Z0-33]
MKKATTYKAAFICILTLFCYTLSAQQFEMSDTSFASVKETEKRKKDYLQLKSLGYTDQEIYEDLGNVYFMSKKFETAVFWYAKLEELQKGKGLNKGYQERYEFAKAKLNHWHVSSKMDQRDWVAVIQEEYLINPNEGDQESQDYIASSASSLELHDKVDQFFDAQMTSKPIPVSQTAEHSGEDTSFEAPMAISADGRVAYFTRAEYVKPTYGLFSKKQLVHKIYKADKINGQWKNVKQVHLSPKNYSSIHPAISGDGKRLFFASDMPGTYGKFDIYVAAIREDGSLGVAKNLGDKVNSKKNDLYPNMVDGTTLFFASDGRKGYGGMDLYMAQVGQRKVQWSVNLGSPINSEKDDFSIFLSEEKGKGYVMSNRGEAEGNVQRVVFSYASEQENTSKAKMEYNLLEALNTSSKIDYSNAFFDDE